jgi:AcrR family transcriptional regulator
MSTLTRREREKEQNRLQILAAAEAVFARHGFHRTTMDAIAKEAEWSKGALYLHFKSKEELFFSLLLERLEAFGRIMNQNIHDAHDLEEAVRILVTGQLEFYIQHQHFFKLILTEQGKLMMSSDKSFRLKLIQQQNSHLKRISALVNGLLPVGSTVQATTLVMSVFGTINVHMMNWMHTDGDFDLDGITEEIIALFLKGVLNET